MKMNKGNNYICYKKIQNLRMGKPFLLSGKSAREWALDVEFDSQNLQRLVKGLEKSQEMNLVKINNKNLIYTMFASTR